MMKSFLKIFLFLLFAAQPLLVNAAQHEDIIKQGNDFFQDKQFDEAIHAYRRVLNQGYESSALYYNLGNAYFRSGKIGYAILNYEKGLRLAPGDEDIQYNLQIANARTIDRIKEVPKLFIVQWWESVLTSLSLNGWLIFVLIFYLSLLILIGFFFFIKGSRWQRHIFILGSVNLAILLIGIFLLISSINREGETTFGVLVETATTAKASPDSKSSDAFVIHEGIKFEIQDRLDGWAKIKLVDGKIGWLKLDSFEPI